MNYLQKKSKKHKVTHEFSGRQHFFNVESDSGETHSVCIQASCDCKFMGAQGVANGKICSHILAVFDAVINYGNIKLSFESDNLIQIKRNSCSSLVRPANRKLNEVRISAGESPIHQNKKIEVCELLLKEGKHFFTEARFITGGIADILVLEDFTAIEIVNTETQESLKNKTKEYPKGIKLKVVRC